MSFDVRGDLPPSRLVVLLQTYASLSCFVHSSKVTAIAPLSPPHTPPFILLSSPTTISNLSNFSSCHCSSTLWAFLHSVLSAILALRGLFLFLWSAPAPPAPPQESQTGKRLPPRDPPVSAPSSTITSISPSCLLADQRLLSLPRLFLSLFEKFPTTNLILSSDAEAGAATFEGPQEVSARPIYFFFLARP